MSQKDRVREINLSARGMLDTEFESCLWSMKPADQRARQPEPTYKELQYLPFRVEPNKVWSKLGRSFQIKKGGITYNIVVPGVLALDDAIDGWLPQFDGESAEFVSLIGLTGAELTISGLIECMEALDEHSFPRALTLFMRKTAMLAVGSLAMSRFRELADNPATRHLANLSPPLNLDELSNVIDIFSQDLGVCVHVLGCLEWSARARDVPDGQQFLPPGFWPRAEPQAEGAVPAEDEQLQLGAEEVAAEDERVEVDRDAYYMGELGCLSRLEPQAWFGGRRYIAYIYRALSGELIAILDSATPGNAAYIFRVGTPFKGQPDAWKNDAANTKYELLTRPEDRKGTFIRRFIHAVRWKKRLRQWLEETFPALTS